MLLGYHISTVARTQMQAMQMTFFFFLPSILLSGFMFPFRGMPDWAQWLGEIFPLTHFLRVVRAVMLKGADFAPSAGDGRPRRSSSPPTPPRAEPIPPDAGLTGGRAFPLPAARDCR